MTKIKESMRSVINSSQYLRGVAEDKCEKLGMLERTVEAFLNGKTIHNCPRCETPNLYVRWRDEKEKQYECENCWYEYMGRR